MTLNTRIVIEQPMDVRRVFAFVNDLIGGQPHHLDTSDHEWCRPGERVISNRPGAGLPGWLIVHYGADGPLPDGCECEDDSDEDEHRSCRPSGAIVISLDTGYGYSENGAGCSDLHAWVVRETGRWLDAQHVSWLWLDEYEGTWHRGDEHLEAFGNAAIGWLSGHTD